MLTSMTGYGRGEGTDGLHSFNLEIKTVNNRYIDIVVKMPKHLNYLEGKIKEKIKNRINRGRVEVYIKLEYISELAIDVKADIPMANAYKTALESIASHLNIEDDIELSHLLSFPDLIRTDKKEIDEEMVWKCLETALDMALDDVIGMREKEGHILSKDLYLLIEGIKKHIVAIKGRSPLVVEEYRINLKNRVENLLEEDYNLDEEKLNNEIVFFADKSDINEEIVRLTSHVERFLQGLETEGPIGRKLDFIIQEMNREINTIGSKANDLLIANHVIDVKGNLEKIREQIQNIE